MDKKNKMTIFSIILISLVVVSSGIVWYISKGDSNKVQREVTELTVGDKTTKTDDEEKSSVTTDKRVVVETNNEGYTFDENAKSGSAPLDNEEYQELIDKNSTIQERDTGQEVEETLKNEVSEKIAQAISSFPKANPDYSSSPEKYQYYEVAKEQFGDKNALQDLRNIIQYNEVSIGTVNVARTTVKNELAYEFVLLKSDTQEQAGYVTGIYNTDTKELTSTFSTILRDGQIIKNNWLDNHNQY